MIEDGEFSKGEYKKARVERAVFRSNTKKFLNFALILVMVAAVSWGIFRYNSWKSRNSPGQLISDQGREHVGSGHQHVYNSNPPTSGWHSAQSAEWGVYKEELPDETLVHNLEHGGIWISYRPGIAEDIRKELENFYDKYGRKIIVEPRSKNDTDIALAAWNRLDKFSVSEYSLERVDGFIKAFRNKGPEFVP